MKTPKQNKTSVKEWSAMKRFGERNDKSIRESIERVNKEERKKQTQDDINEHVRQLLESSGPNVPKISTPLSKSRVKRHFEKISDKILDKHHEKELETIKRQQNIKKIQKQVKSTTPQYNLVAPPTNTEQVKQNVKETMKSVPRPESSQSIQASKREALKRASTMQPSYALSLTTQTEDAAIQKIEQAYKRRLQRVEARHELDKSRQTFDPENYQKLLRDNLKKANDALSHYRTRVPTPTPSQKKSIEKVKTKVKSIEMLAKAKATGRPIGTRKEKK